MASFRQLRPCSLRLQPSPSLSVCRHQSSLAPNSWSYPPSVTDVANDEVTRLSSSPRRPLTLADLLRHGRPPLSREALLASANFTLSLLPTRLAFRIQALRNLPFIVVSNPHISKIYNNYVHSLSTLLPYQQRKITTMEEEEQFTEAMADLVKSHTNTITVLARGFLECRKYISPAEVTKFLEEHLRARIGTRLIAQQHLELHYASQRTGEGNGQSADQARETASNYIGVIDTALQPAKLIRSCEDFVAEICELKYGVRPRVVINGEVDATFAYVPVHVEYIITELLKNTFRAVIESGSEREAIEITIASAPDVPGNSTSERLSAPKSSDHARSDAEVDFRIGKEPLDDADTSNLVGPLNSPTQNITIRIRDRGGGISPEVLPQIWSYSFTTYKEEEATASNPGSGVDALNAISNSGVDSSTLAGLGYGLPLGRAYAEYFGGGIAVQSLWGWGTDVYLTLQGIGKVE